MSIWGTQTDGRDPESNMTQLHTAVIDEIRTTTQTFGLFTLVNCLSKEVCLGLQGIGYLDLFSAVEPLL